MHHGQPGRKGEPPAQGRDRRMADSGVEAHRRLQMTDRLRIGGAFHEPPPAIDDDARGGVARIVPAMDCEHLTSLAQEPLDVIGGDVGKVKQWMGTHILHPASPYACRPPD